MDLGLWDLEQQLSSERGVDPHMAHTHLLTDYESALTQDSTLELFNRMAVEIMKAVNFYNYNNREQSLRSVYLCGGGAAIAPLRERTSARSSPAMWKRPGSSPGLRAAACKNSRRHLL